VRKPKLGGILAMAVLGLAPDERFTPKIGDKILRIEIETGDNKSICRETLKEC